MSSYQFFIYQIFSNYYQNPRNPDILQRNHHIFYFYYDEKNKITLSPIIYETECNSSIPSGVK